jgi:hypothetical protein
VRFIVVMTLACALGACASGNIGTPMAGEWKIEPRADRVAEKPINSAWLVARSRNHRASEQSPVTPQLASLQLLCFDGDPVVRFHFTVDVGSNRNSRLAYKVDNSPARRPNARILQDFQTIMIEDKKDVAQFVTDLRGARRLDVTVTALVNGTTIVDFNVEGAAAAIDTAFATCPLPAQPAPRVSGSDLRMARDAR